MTDIICIPVEVFLQLKSKVEADSKINQQYAHLITSYPCFTTTVTHLHFEQRSRVTKVHKHFQARQQHAHEGRRRTVIVTNDPLKKIKGLLNIVNTSNFERVNRKLQLTIDEANAHSVCMLLINTACSQIFFVHVFMKLLYHCMQTSPKMLNTCTTFVDDFFHNSNTHIEGVDTQDFADYQKQKRHTINQAVIVMEIIKNKYAKQYNVQHFLTFILNKLQSSQSTVEIDILLSILIEVRKRSANVRFETEKFAGIDSICCDQRIRFMVETLLK
jgi:hypothetical protein